MVYCILFALNGFAPITHSKSLEDVTGPLSGPERVDPEAYGRESGENSAFPYITYAMFDMLLDTNRKNALYKLGTNWNDLN